MRGMGAALAGSAVKPAESFPSPAGRGLDLPLLSALLAFLVAQFLKVVTTWMKEKRWDIRGFLKLGGMPSSLSSTVAGLAVSIGVHDGLNSPSFALSVVIAAVVMYDASGIRFHAGQQAALLNQVACVFLPEQSVSSIRLHEFLGHTPLQVLAGAMVGCAVSYVMRNLI